MNYNEKQIKNLTKAVEEVTALKNSALSILSSVITPELESEMSPQQKQFMKEADNAFNSDGLPLDKKLDQLNELTFKYENIFGNK